MPPKLGAFDGFMTIIKKYTKARGWPPLHFIVKTIIATTSTNKNKKVRSYRQHPIWKPKKLESFYKVQKVVCASQFLLDFHQVGLVWININSCNPHVVECHIVNKWGNPCPWLLNFQTKFTKVGIFVVWKVYSHFVLFGVVHVGFETLNPFLLL